MNKYCIRIIICINFLIVTFLSMLAQDYSREQGRADFRRSCDALNREIPTQILICFDSAYSEIRQMLVGEKELSFKRAVFLVENCYYEGKLNWDEYNGEINRIKPLLYRMIKQRGLENYKTCGNWAVFTYMSDSIKENGYNPYTYDIENFMNSWGASDRNDVGIEGNWNSPQEFLKMTNRVSIDNDPKSNQNLNMYNYTDAFVIKTTPEQDRTIGHTFSDYANTKYDFATNNCATIVQNSIISAGIKSAPLPLCLPASPQFGGFGPTINTNINVIYPQPHAAFSSIMKANKGVYLKK